MPLDDHGAHLGAGARRLRTAAVLPIRGHASLLDGVLDSLAHQTASLDEIIVVDDGPTPTLTPRSGTRVVSSGGVGPYAARNLGVASSSADVVFFLDARSRPRPDWVARSVRAFDDEGVGIVGSETIVRGGATIAAKAAEVQQFSNLDKYIAAPFFLPYLPTCNLAVRREDFDAVDGFSSVRSGGDADLCWRIQRATGHRLEAITDVLMEWVPRDRARELLEQNYRYGKSHHGLRVEWSDRGLPVVEPLPLWRLLARTGRSVVSSVGALVTDRGQLPSKVVRMAGVCYDWGYWRAHLRAR